MSSRVIVTGGGRGLGRALTAALLARGHRVAVTVRDPSRADVDPRAIVVPMDVEDESSVRDAVASAVDALGGLDLLVNCAGTNAKSYPGAEGTIRIADLTAEPFLGIMRVNTVGPLLVARAALPALRKSPAPRIVNISSWLGSIAGTTHGWNYAYAASKAGLNMVSRILANELRDDGIAVLAVNPGWVRTDMGGPRAEVTPEAAAGEIVELAERLTIEGTGRFVDRDGTEHPW